MKQIFFMLLIASTFCYLVNSAAPDPDATPEPTPGGAEATKRTIFKTSNVDFKMPLQSSIYIVNGTELGNYLSEEFKKVIQKAADEEAAHPRQGRDTNEQAARVNYLIHGSLEAIPLN